MKTIRIVLNEKLLRAMDQAARLTKQNRSALVRAALREYLRRINILALEERDRDGYTKLPQQRDEANTWEPEAAWPARVPCA
jgi:metal-responsive CopG/Arc/MetJ family transcriptional regulator